MSDGAQGDGGRPLEHPLPAGMRDLLPEEARSRRAVARALLSSFELHGYAIVAPPAFEFADVLERGLGTLDPADVLRFVEPESGEVAALRPDMTPQVARMIATRLRARPPPYRLCYEGTVMRRRSTRARRHRQIPQVGIELAGLGAPEGDFELLAAMADALAAVGLSKFVLELGHSGIVRALLEGTDSDVALRVTDALSRKDEVELQARLEEAKVPHARTLLAVARLHGQGDALDEGQRLLAKTPAADAFRRLRELFDGVRARGLGDRVAVDLGEVRGFSYYTGALFHLYAPGPGEAVGSGGRYDELLGRFGAPMPAVGFALDLDGLAWALRSASSLPRPGVRVVVVGSPEAPAVASLRAAGVPAVGFSGREGALRYARAWAFSHVVEGDVATEVSTGRAGPVKELGAKGGGSLGPK